jgi:hypothetical protein
MNQALLHAAPTLGGDPLRAKVALLVTRSATPRSF